MNGQHTPYSGFVRDWPHLGDLPVSIELNINGMKKEKERMSRDERLDGVSEC